MTWTIVLAGGSGARLADESRRRYGYARPKQYCAFDGHGTLLDRAIGRARRFSAPEQIVVITTRAHRSEAREVLDGHPGVVHLEQPRGRDTTPGLLLPLLYVLSRGPDDPLLMLPADHHVESEALFAEAVGRAIDAVTEDPGRVAMLAAEPGSAPEDYGWVVPRVPGDPRSGVMGFREKPGAAEIEHLRAQGALVNTFVLVAKARMFAALMATRTPGWWRVLTGANGDAMRIEAAYDVLPSSNFSREVLEKIPHLLHLVTVPSDAGWSDVGTPARLARAFTPEHASIRQSTEEGHHPPRAR